MSAKIAIVFKKLDKYLQAIIFGIGKIVYSIENNILIETINMFFGIGILATLIATIASVLVDKKFMEKLGMSSYQFEDHIVLCEWNYQAEINNYQRTTS